MAIIFHCEYCNKKIEAGDAGGGKWGKCPSCHNKLYIPAAKTGEGLKLAPVDAAEEQRKKQLMSETYKLEQDILMEKGPAPEAAVADKDLMPNIILYLRQMLNGDLDDAGITIDLITPYGRQAVNILDRIAVSDMPEPELTDIPQQILAGLIKNLRSKIAE